MVGSVLMASAVRLVVAHGYLAKPTSKGAADMQSIQLPWNDYWQRATWFVEKAYLNNDQAQKPWSQPGRFNYTQAWDISQQVFHPCGCYNPGGLQYCAGVTLASGFGETTPGHSQNGPFPRIDPPVWAPGSQQETAFSFYVNHHGGYVYMLCKKTTLDGCKSVLPQRIQEATQAQIFAYSKCAWDCFESNVLDFVPDTQTLQFEDREDLTVKVRTVTKGPTGTMPPGSIWREVPLPDQHMVSSGDWPGLGRCNWDAIDPSSFSNEEARQKFIQSFGDDSVCDSNLDNHHPKQWHFKDKVAVPQSLPEGEYVLSWRWDCAAEDKSWSNCADVLVSAVGQQPTPEPASAPVTEPVTKPEPEEAGGGRRLRGPRFV